MDDKALKQVKEAILGKKIQRVDEGNYLYDSTLVLEDGTTLELFESEQDCCAGAGGDWKILVGADLEAGITDIEFELTADNEDDGFDSYYSSATITILHNQNPLVQGLCDANAGNGGYYFSVLSLRVKVPYPDETVKEMIHDVVSA